MKRGGGCKATAVERNHVGWSQMREKEDKVREKKPKPPEFVLALVWVF